MMQPYRSLTVFLLMLYIEAEPLICPPYCRTKQNTYCLCDTGYGEYGGKREARVLNAFDPMIEVKQRDICAKIRDLISYIYNVNRAKKSKRRSNRFMFHCRLRIR